jgi:hypothetical protein
VAGRKERSMPWTYYHAAGKPVPEKAATFRCREMSVDGSAPAPPGHRSLGAIEYHDVHAIDQPDPRIIEARKHHIWTVLFDERLAEFS